MIKFFNGIKNAAIITHIRPDGDALGSMLALKTALEKRNISVDSYCDSEIPDYLAFLPQAKMISNGQFSKKYDALISVDCGDLNRLGKYQQDFVVHTKTLNIDHHHSNPNFAKTNYVIDSASTCEIIFKLISDLKIELDKDIAKCLYAGIITDTGSFAQANTTPNCHYTAAKLLEFGLEPDTLADKLYKELKKQKLALLGECFTQARMFDSDKICLLTIRLETLNRLGLNISDTEGIVSYSINLQGVLIGICMCETESGKYKISMRSKRGTDVSKIAAVFGGGGHMQASGLMMTGMYEDVVEKLIYQCKLAL